jgi:putative membrane protein
VKVRGRFPARIFGRGDEPDPRFSLANERTFLAWIRTSLALLLAGVALEALDVPVEPWLRFAAAVMFIVLGFLAVVHSWLSWASTERSLRHVKPLPGFGLSAIISGGSALAIAMLLVAMLVA